MEVREFLNQVGKKMHERSLQREEESLLSELSVGLRAKLAHAINHYYLCKVPLFSRLKDKDMMSQLCMCISSAYVSAGEDIVREGDAADAIFFIVSGSVEVLVKQVVLIPKDERDIDDSDECKPAPDSPDQKNGSVRFMKKEVEKRVALMGNNEFFGERAILKKLDQRSATVRAVTFTECRVLSRASFLRVSENFPDFNMEEFCHHAQTAHAHMKGPGNTPPSDDEGEGNSAIIVASDAPLSAGLRSAEQRPPTKRFIAPDSPVVALGCVPKDGAVVADANGLPQARDASLDRPSLLSLSQSAQGMLSHFQSNAKKISQHGSLIQNTLTRSRRRTFSDLSQTVPLEPEIEPPCSAPKPDMGSNFFQFDGRRTDDGTAASAESTQPLPDARGNATTQPSVMMATAAAACAEVFERRLATLLERVDGHMTAQTEQITAVNERLARVEAALAASASSPSKRIANNGVLLPPISSPTGPAKCATHPSTSAV